MKFLIPMLVGGTIGYFTNWLAIKMLFRPYEEKYIFGMKVPFTPGLIPKERFRVAKSVGNTVADYLLTAETLMDVMGEEKTKKGIEKWFKKLLEKNKDSDKKIEDILNEMGFKDYELKAKINSEISKLIVKELNKKENKMRILVYMEKIYDYGQDKLIVNLKDNGMEYLEKLLYTEDNKDYMKKLLSDKLCEYKEDDRNLEEILPEDIKKLIDDKLEENRYEFVRFIRTLFKNREINYQIQKAIRNMIQENLGSLLSMFVNMDSISNKLYLSIENYLFSSNGENLIYTGLDKIKEEIYKKDVSTIARNLLGKHEELVDNLLEVVEANKLDEKILVEIEKLVKEKSAKYKEDILGNSYREVVNLLEGDRLYDFIGKIINKLLVDLYEVELRDIVKLLDDNSEKLKDLIDRIINSINYDTIIEFIELLNIAEIVENQINSFEIDFAEELILEIAGKELKAITNLGALLGAVLGLMTPFMQIFY